MPGSRRSCRPWPLNWSGSEVFLCFQYDSLWKKCSCRNTVDGSGQLYTCLTALFVVQLIAVTGLAWFLLYRIPEIAFPEITISEQHSHPMEVKTVSGLVGVDARIEQISVADTS